MKEGGKKRDYNTWIRYSALGFLATKTKRKYIKLHSFHFLTKKKDNFIYRGKIFPGTRASNNSSRKFFCKWD